MSSTVKTNKRILALDILRGVTIAGMIMVNNPGTWAHIYAPLRHAEWNGLTPTDLVFPFFMFIMGISTYISLKKYNFEFSRAAGRPGGSAENLAQAHHANPPTIYSTDIENKFYTCRMTIDNRILR